MTRGRWPHIHHMTVAGKYARSEFIHKLAVIFCIVGLHPLPRSSLQVSTHIAHHSKALLKPILKPILPYVAEAVDGGEEGSFFTYVQVNIGT